MAEQNKILQEQERKKKNSSVILLPWETDDESRSIFSQELMEMILSLPLSENNFTIPPAGFKESEFTFDDFVPLALKMLSLDSNLARVHAKLMPHMNEEVFWRNYFFRITYLRFKVGIIQPEDGEHSRFLFSSDEYDTMIFKPDATLSKILPSRQKLTTKTDDAVAAKTTLANKSSEEKSDTSEEKRGDLDAQLAAEVQAELEGIDELVDLTDLGDIDAATLELSDIDEQHLLNDILDNEQGIQDDPDYEHVPKSKTGR
jgi:hypothetical protein